MGNTVNLLIAVKISDEFLMEYEGLSLEDIAYYFLEQIQSDYDSAGVDFELLEVY